MKATGIVRRVEECVIIGQTAPNPHKHWGFHWFAPLNALVPKCCTYVMKAKHSV